MKIIAHRGASGEFPENSLLAFEQAIIQGCDGIELDVQYHQASGEFILLHDQYLQYKGLHTHFNQLTLKQLLSINPARNRNICTLSSALDTISTHCVINIEVKSSSQGAQLTQEIMQLKLVIQQAQAKNIINNTQLIISSFNHHALVATSTLLPQLSTAALIACCPINYAQFCRPLKVAKLNVATNCLNHEIVTDAHSLGLELWVYTVDSLDEIKQCLAYGVDGIFTNFPQRSRDMMLALRRV
jgi:glycerophosphoryl diester phosphodiesterase